MKFVVILTPAAEAELEEAFWYIQTRSPLNAKRWLRGINSAIDSLELFPHRCADAREGNYLGFPLKHYIFKSHRIIFWIEESTAKYMCCTFGMVPSRGWKSFEFRVAHA